MFLIMYIFWLIFPLIVGDTLLTCAARLGHLELLRYLINSTGLDVTVPDNHGLSIVDYAIMNSDKKMFSVRIMEYYGSVGGVLLCLSMLNVKL